MGPKWFVDINPRFASPIKTHVLLLIITQILIAVYIFWTNNPMQALTLTLQQVFGLFGLTAIAALLFPYRKRSKMIWESSPYHESRILGVPTITWGAIVYLIYLTLLAIAFFAMPDTGAFTWASAGFIACSWGAGIVWYFVWKSRASKEGIDLATLSYNQLPPD